MDEQEFNRVVSATRLSKVSRDAARLVFVEGKKAVEVGEAMSLSPVRMSQIARAIREAREKLDGQTLTVAGDGQSGGHVAAVQASYAVVVKQARDQLGDDVALVPPSELTRNVGPVVARTDYHLVQSVGKGQAVVHELALLDRPPAVGRNVTIEYKSGRGAVSDRDNQRPRGGRSL